MAQRKDRNEGEGSRTADAQYRRGVRQTILTKDINKLAEEAMRAVEEDQGELAEAEAIGRAPATRTPHVDAKLVDLAQIRDEVRVRMHLAKADAKDAFEKLEARFFKLVGKVGAVKDASEQTASDVKAATGLVIEELKEGYERLKRELTT